MDDTLLTPRGLERRIKKKLLARKQTFAVITVPGFEKVTEKELHKIADGATITCDRGILEFDGPFDLLYRLNLQLRTAGRVLLRVASFRARSYPELYNKLQRIHWELHTGFHPEISFVVSSRSSRLHHTGKIAETAFDAINAVMTRLGLPKQSVAGSPVAVHLRFIDDCCSISMDTTGALLYKRGYRTATGIAPLRETTAAAMLLAARWDRYPVIADPCCGSGSIIIEAVHIASGKPPGDRRKFAFFSWPSFQPQRLNYWRKKAAAEPVPRRFAAGDVDPQALRALRINCKTLNASSRIEIFQRDCREFNSDGTMGSRGLLLSNLPFGKRVGVAGGTEVFFREFGNALKKNCTGWSFGFLVADPLFGKHSGLECTAELEFSNGGIGVRFVTGHIT